MRSDVNTSKLGFSMTPSISLLRANFEFCGAEARDLVWQILLSVDQRVKGLACTAGAVVADNLEKRRVGPVFQPDNIDTPPCAALLHEVQCLRHFTTCVLERHDAATLRDTRVRLNDPVKQIGAGASAAERDLNIALGKEIRRHDTHIPHDCPKWGTASRAQFNTII